MTNSRRIILKIEGGLGNQLFQFAAGYYIAAKLKTHMEVDQYSIPLSTKHGERSYGFGEFDFESTINSKEIRILKALPSDYNIKLATRFQVIKKLLLKVRMKTSNLEQLPIFIEGPELEEFFRITSPVKLHGNFQSWKIVQSARELGFPDQLFLKRIPRWITLKARKIDFENSILLHIRCGEDALANLAYSQPKTEYYLSALKYLRRNNSNLKVYILTDNLNFARREYTELFQPDSEILELDYVAAPAEKMYLMSLFENIICANSTFCQWAAWSIGNRGGKVIVPFPISDNSNLGSRDFPDSWLKLSKTDGKVH